MGVTARLAGISDSMEYLRHSMDGIGLLRERISSASQIRADYNSLFLESLISDNLWSNDFGRHSAHALMPESILEQQHRAIQPYLEEQRRITALMEPYLEEQRRIAAMIEPYLEEQRRIAAMMEPYLEEQRRIVALMEPYLEEQRRITAMLEPYLEDLRRIAANTRKNLSS